MFRRARWGESIKPESHGQKARQCVNDDLAKKIPDSIQSINQLFSIEINPSLRSATTNCTTTQQATTGIGQNADPTNNIFSSLQNHHYQAQSTYDFGLPLEMDSLEMDVFHEFGDILSSDSDSDLSVRTYSDSDDSDASLPLPVCHVATELDESKQELTDLGDPFVDDATLLEVCGGQQNMTTLSSSLSVATCGPRSSTPSFQSKSKSSSMRGGRATRMKTPPIKSSSELDQVIFEIFSEEDLRLDKSAWAARIKHVRLTPMQLKRVKELRRRILSRKYAHVNREKTQRRNKDIVSSKEQLVRENEQLRSKNLSLQRELAALKDMMRKSSVIPFVPR